MHDTQDQRLTQPGSPLFITDTQLAPMLGVSVSFLRRDRIEGRRIPFIKLGDRCLYDLQDVLAAMRALKVGGHARSGQRRHTTRKT